MNINRFRGGFNVALQWLVGWFRRRRGYVCGVDIGIDEAETTVWAKIRNDGTIEVIDIVETKPANNVLTVSGGRKGPND
jgi:hypothetical protein